MSVVVDKFVRLFGGNVDNRGLALFHVLYLIVMFVLLVIFTAELNKVSSRNYVCTQYDVYNNQNLTVLSGVMSMDNAKRARDGFIVMIFFYAIVRFIYSI
jgi:hypothetical protein